MSNGPLIVQSDRSVLLEVAHEHAEDARRELAVFAELERAPEHMHSYRITQLGLWNARAAGHDANQIVTALERYAKFPVPSTVIVAINEIIGRYGRLVIDRTEDDVLRLSSADRATLLEVVTVRKVAALLGDALGSNSYQVAPWARGTLKQELLKLGWPAEDNAGYTPGAPHQIELNLAEWHLRHYQEKATHSFVERGSGVVVLPCGAGKTMVGAAAMAALKTTTLILVTNTVSIRQWKDELLRRTSLTEVEIGEYSGSIKDVKPVTIATYQILSAQRAGVFTHLALLDARDWGLVIYDEVHLLPAPVFKLSADLQARRRLGLTATLIREDGREGEVFSLIGPKRFDASWRELEAEGFIAPAECFEVRVDLSVEERLLYATTEEGERYRKAATSVSKVAVVRALVAKHFAEPTLVIAQYLDQIAVLAEALGAPALTGETPITERERLFAEFRSGQISLLVVSKVANFSVDLPEASVAIQVSGSFGSRQEEAQRLGRILRPKAGGGGATFYTLVARDTVEQMFALNRQRFLAEQGYSYSIVDAVSFLPG